MTTGLSMDDALNATGTGDIWLFRGPSKADKAIRAATNSPVNHVAITVALDDLPPLLWHTELGHSLDDLWSGDRHRGAQLNLLSEALPVWITSYGQRAFLRQLDAHVTREMEDGLLRVIERLDGRPFPRTTRLARFWLAGRFRKSVHMDTIYCAELTALSYQEMGLLERDRPANWFDPGRFWSGDRLPLTGSASLGPELEVKSPA
ncbi:MAG: hypothetical protein ACR2PK_08415 [Acidimicrobiales bacterium]